MCRLKKSSAVPAVFCLKGSTKYQMNLHTTRTGRYKKTKKITLFSLATIHIMESQQGGKAPSEHRFQKVLVMLRLAGIPLNMHRVPRLYTVYSELIVACFYITYFASLMDLVFNAVNLVGAMKTMRTLIGMQFSVWVHLFFR
jgi:hypothetical protein